MSKIRSNTKIVLIVAGVLLVLGTLAGYVAMAGSTAKAPSKYIAEINGNKIERNQFERDFFYVWQQQNEMSYGQLTGLDQEPLKAQYLMQLLMREALLDEAKKLKLEAAKDEVDAQLKEIEDSVGGADELKVRLEMMGITIDDLKGDIKESIVFQKLQEHLTKDVTVSEADLRNQFQEVNASHILVDDKSLADELYKKLQDGADFAELAKEYSTDPGSKDQGGELGFFGRGVMIPEFENVAFTLADGDISEPVRSDYGYHIIKVHEHKEVDDETFNEKKAEVEEEVLYNKKNELLSKYIVDLKDKATIKIYDAQLRAWHYMSEGKIEDAIKSYHEAEKERPGDPYVSVSLAEAYRRKGDLDKAWDLYKQASANTNEPAVQINLALIGQTKIQNIINAQETDEEKSIVEWAAENSDINLVYSDIIKALEQASKAASDDLWTHLQIAQVYNLFGDNERGQAEMDLIKAITEKLDAEENTQETDSADAETVTEE